MDFEERFGLGPTGIVERFDPLQFLFSAHVSPLPFFVIRWMRVAQSVDDFGRDAPFPRSGAVRCPSPVSFACRCSARCRLLDRFFQTRNDRRTWEYRTSCARLLMHEATR